MSRRSEAVQRGDVGDWPGQVGVRAWRLDGPPGSRGIGQGSDGGERDLA